MPGLGSGAARESLLVRIPAGHYEPLYRRPSRDGLPTSRVAVPAFWLASHAVTNSEYLAFVREHPEWRRSNARRLFVDESYLRHWRSDLDFGDSTLAESPVVNVSWFAARAYCAAHGHQLPTVDQWEYAGAASERSTNAMRDTLFQDRLRAWYSRPTPERLAHVRSTFRNVYGVWDMHGLIWEWTSDFSSALVNGESRADEALDRSLYCGSGAANAADFRDYAAFMRFAFRSSLSARYCVANLGFREAATLPRSDSEPAGGRP
ncbi:MAG: formylglycine-generating enzyme family protein [Candidatus Eisenbacteria bacterium]|uniref:Formylglycine-generating enzyme family protein n=1 Tax=Eiseniibacteriota bacterium TaxID=2212470 RepID=A0A849SKB7_UNCEI|nr:formylglycine-generating enzyme family protein [Candidatus Eisenbacteria bacterium]